MMGGVGKSIHRTLNVLVVDDHGTFRTFVHDILMSEGLTVHETRNEKEALAAFSSGSYDLMLLDFKWPDINDTDVLESVREDSPETVVVVITGYNDINLALIFSSLMQKNA